MLQGRRPHQILPEGPWGPLVAPEDERILKPTSPLPPAIVSAERPVGQHPPPRRAGPLAVPLGTGGAARLAPTRDQRFTQHPSANKAFEIHRV